MRHDIRLLDEIEEILDEVGAELRTPATEADETRAAYTSEYSDLLADLDTKRALDLNFDGSFEALRDTALLLLSKVRLLNGHPATDT